MLTFLVWLETTLHNKADLVLPAIQQAGRQGITVRRLANLVGLEPDVVAALVDSLVGMGVAASRSDGDEVRVWTR